ncbi:chromosome partition protein Smc [Acrasis kona]|uniref:Chromosome partition protein Smc n=1 Tax=Acrasis kona TaxID=1008807 RepID=A0AAW2YNM7_9EUKA
MGLHGANRHMGKEHFNGPKSQDPLERHSRCCTCHNSCSGGQKRTLYKIGSATGFNVGETVVVDSGTRGCQPHTGLIAVAGIYGKFAYYGDSGALVYEKIGGEFYVFGVVTSGNEQFTYVTPFANNIPHLHTTL